MPSLKKLFDNGKRRYQELRDGAEEAIVRREWATFGRHWLEPYYAESNCFGLGALVSLPIDDTRGLVEHGFDAVGRLRVVRNYSALNKREWLPGRGPERPAREQYFDYADEEVIATLFDHDEKKPVINVARYRYEGTQLIEVQTRYKNGNERTETFEWADGRPVRARVSQPGNERVLEYKHDAAGELELVEWVYANGSRAEMFRRIREEPEVVFERVRGALLASTRSHLPTLDVGAKVAAVALWLDMESHDHLLPPQLALLTEAEQADFLSEHADDAATFLWHPVEWENYDTQELEFEDESLHRAPRHANQLVGQRSLHDAARLLVDSVCRELNEEGVSTLLETTPDCIIFPVDITSGDGEQGVRRVVTPSQLTALKRQGLLRD